jgi:hypothetical protein
MTVDRPQPASLDGRTFHGVVLECGKSAGDPDTLIFGGGKFRSTACDRYGYDAGTYNAVASDDVIAFEARTHSARYGVLLWRGTVRGPRLDAAFTMLRGEVVVGEKWVLAGEAQP